MTEGKKSTKSSGSGPSKAKVLKEAVLLYLEMGYEKTTLDKIAKRLNCLKGYVTNHYKTKDDILLELVKFMAQEQFNAIEHLLKDRSPLFVYCHELAVELYMCEKLENVRDLYVTAYSHKTTLDYIKNFSYKKSMSFFGDIKPDWSEKDFAEKEILTTGMIFGCIMERCTPHFTIKQKIEVALTGLLDVYRIPIDTQREVIEEVLASDLQQVADSIAECAMQRAQELHP